MPPMLQRPLLPTVAGGETARAQEDARTIIGTLDSPRFITLTLRHSNDPLADQLKHLRKAFARLRDSKLWRQHFGRGISCVEVTHNADTDQWHPHVHIVADGHFIAHTRLRAAWEQASGGSRIVDIRLVRSRREASNYIGKCIGKSSAIEAIPNHRLAEFLHAFTGLRTHSLIGKGCRKIIKPREKTDCSKLEHAASLTAIYNDAHYGSQVAREIIRALRPVTTRKFRDPAQTPPAIVEETNRRIAGLLRTWHEERETHSRPESPGRAPPDRKRNGPHCGTVGLWQNATDAPPSPGTRPFTH